MFHWQILNLKVYQEILLTFVITSDVYDSKLGKRWRIVLPCVSGCLGSRRPVDPQQSHVSGQPKLYRIVCACSQVSWRSPFLQVRKGYPIILTPSLAFVFLQIVSLWNDDLLPSAHCTAALAYHSLQVPIGIELAFKSGEFGCLHSLPPLYNCARGHFLTLGRRRSGTASNTLFLPPPRGNLVTVSVIWFWGRRDNASLRWALPAHMDRQRIGKASLRNMCQLGVQNLRCTHQISHTLVVATGKKCLHSEVVGQLQARCHCSKSCTPSLNSPIPPQTHGTQKYAKKTLKAKTLRTWKARNCKWREAESMVQRTMENPIFKRQHRQEYRQLAMSTTSTTFNQSLHSYNAMNARKQESLQLQST